MLFCGGYSVSTSIQESEDEKVGRLNPYPGLDGNAGSILQMSYSLNSFKGGFMWEII